MARFTFSINGMLDLEPISFDKVDKFYTTQHEFLRDTSVLTSKSRYSEMLHLATFAFDVSDATEVEKLKALIAICNSFPYVFIRSDAIIENHLMPLNLAIGSGYYMYALHEFQAEMSSTDADQGVVTVSLRLQMVNWKPLAKSIKFISIEEGAEVKTKSGKVRNISEYNGEEGDSVVSTGSYVKYVDNPEESNILSFMVEKNASEDIEAILNSGLSRSFEFNLGWPLVMTDLQFEDRPKSDFCWNHVRQFRVLKTVDLDGSLQTKDGKKSSQSNISEVTEENVERYDETGRIWVGYVRERLAGTNVKDGDVALQSITVRRRNRFANQTVQGFVYPYAQYLGRSPSEVLITTAVNHTKGMASTTAMQAVKKADEMTNYVRVSTPALKGLDVLAIENPLVNGFGIKYAVLDSSHATTSGSLNNLLINNFTFIESDSYGAIESSRYVLASSVNGWNDSANKAQRLIEVISQYKALKKDGSSTSEYDTIISTINNRLIDALNRTVKSELQEAKTLQESDVFKKADATQKSVYIIQLYMQLISANTASGSEERITLERVRLLDSEIESLYFETVTNLNPITIKALKEDLQKEKNWIEKMEGNYTSFNGEGIPDLKIKEIFEGLTPTKEYKSWRDLSSFPFIYDQGILSPDKVVAYWDEKLPEINSLLEATGALIKTDLNIYTTAPAMNDAGGNSTTGASVMVQDPSGGTSPKGKADVKLVYTREQYERDYKVSTGSNKRLLPLENIVAYTRLGRDLQNFGGRHFGLDMPVPVGTPVRVADDGVVAVAKFQMNRNGKRGYGNVIYVKHANGIETRYAHLSRILVREGSRVGRGQVIGLSGNTGGSTGPHLHYEIRINGKVISPKAYYGKTTNGPTSIATSSRTNSSHSAAAYARGGSKARSGIMTLKEFISAGESGGSYDIANWYTGKKLNSGNKGLSNKTIAQIIALQSTGQLHAVGKYQTIPVTLRAAVQGLRLNGNTPFSPSVQEKIGTWLIFNKRPALGAYIRGESNDLDKAHREFAQEWRSIPMPDGRSASARGDKVHSGYTPERVRQALLAARASYVKSLSSGKSKEQAQEEAVASTALARVASGENVSDVASSYINELYAGREKDPIEAVVDPVPWTEEIQAKSRLENFVKDLNRGIQKLIPTYKVYMVHGNDENSLINLINYRQHASYYEVPAVRNIRVEMANQDNPVAVATFEVLNALNTASDPKEIRVLKSENIDIRSLNSDAARIVAMDQIRLKAGNKIQIRMGYGNDPNKLSVVFNGIVTESDGGEVLTIVAEGYGRELQNEQLFIGDVVPTFSFLSDIDNLYVSAAVAKVLKSANLDSFGRNPRWFADNADFRDVRGMSNETAASNIVGDSGIGFSNSLWNSQLDEYFFYSAKGATESLENFWLMNVDMADRFFVTSLKDLFPFSLNDFFSNFNVVNKTVWDVLTTGRRMFPSSILLVKNIEGRSTTFSGIKEQMMIGKEKPTSLAAEFLAKIQKKADFKKEADEALAGDTTGIGNSYVENHMKDKVNVIGEQTLKSNGSDIIDLLDAANADKYVDVSSYVPATNFHMFNSSYNLISNQMKLDQNCITGAKVEYNSDPEDFGYGENIFDMKANGGLKGSLAKFGYINDNSISSVGMAIKTAQGYLLEELEKMYTGAVIVTGNPDIQPGDYAFIQDDLRNMSGVIKCREVQHVFTEYDGYVTIITPGMFVEPSTHMYSNLYMKLGIFMNFVSTAASEYAQISSAETIPGLIYEQTAFQPTDLGASVYLLGAGNAAIGAATGALIYNSASRILGGSLLSRASSGLSLAARAGKAVAGAGWVRSLAHTVMSFGSSVGSKALQALPRVARVISTVRGFVAGGRAVATAAMGFAAGGFIATAAVSALLVVLVYGALAMVQNLIESFALKLEMRHRALMKFPVKVYGQEYTASLTGWNDTETPLELQWDTVKEIVRALGDINEATNRAGYDGSQYALYFKLATD